MTIRAQPQPRPLSQGWTLARAVWVSLALLALIPTVVSWPVYYGALRRVCEACLVTPAFAATLQAAGWSMEAWALWKVAWPVLITAGWAGMGWLIFARRSADRQALAMSALLVLTAPGFGGLAADLGRAVPRWLPLLHFTNFLGSACAFALIMTLPTGRFAPRWTVGPLIYLSAVTAPNSFWPGSPLAFRNWPGWANAVFFVLPLVTCMIVVPIFRYWRIFSATERQQAKWAIAGLVAAAAGVIATVAFMAITLPGAEQETASPALRLQASLVQDVGWSLSLLLIPAFIGVAILRSKLWGIDVLIRRTLVYSVLSALLALAYFGSVLVLQNVFRAVTGEGRSALVTVLSTLVIAALFVPLRSRVQRAIDRRFYRQKYNAARTLAAFGAQARDVVELEQLSDQLVQAVDETMQPAHVGLWVRTDQHGR